MEVIKLKQMANHLPVAGGSMIMHDPGPFPTSLTLIRRRGNHWNSIQGTWPKEKWNQRYVGQMISTWSGSSGKLIYHEVSCVTLKKGLKICVVVTKGTCHPHSAKRIVENMCRIHLKRHSQKIPP